MQPSDFSVSCPACGDAGSEIGGQTEESAKAQLAELDAEPSITYENSSETKGIVIRQDVNEGTQLKHRQTVAFVVSLGPKEETTAPEDTPVAIPSFVGLSFEQAQATAKSLGVTVEKNGTAYDDNVQKGAQATPDAEFLQLRPPAGEGTTADD